MAPFQMTAWDMSNAEAYEWVEYSDSPMPATHLRVSVWLEHGAPLTMQISALL